MAKKVNKISKQKGVEILLNSLREGKTYSEQLRAFKSKFGIVESTFALWWKSANLIYSKEVAEIRKELFELKKESERKALEGAILSKEQSLIMLTEIAKGMHNETDEPTKVSDKIKAILELNKLAGNYKDESINLNIERPLFCNCQEPRILTKQEIKDNKEQIEKVIDKLDKEY